MSRVTVTKTFIDPITGEELIYVYTATGADLIEAEQNALLYVSMIEYGVVAENWSPREMYFPEEMLYQFIQPATLAQFKGMYQNIVQTAYESALSYVQSYIGSMFDVDAILSQEESTATATTLRLALCMSTVNFILSSSPAYSEVVESNDKKLQMLLRGLKSGNRSFGRGSVTADPNARVEIVSLTKTGAKA